MCGALSRIVCSFQINKFPSFLWEVIIIVIKMGKLLNFITSTTSDGFIRFYCAQLLPMTWIRNLSRSNFLHFIWFSNVQGKKFFVHFSRKLNCRNLCLNALAKKVVQTEPGLYGKKTFCKCSTHMWNSINYGFWSRWKL